MGGRGEWALSSPSCQPFLETSLPCQDVGEALGVSGLLSSISGGLEGVVDVLPGPPPRGLLMQSVDVLCSPRGRPAEHGVSTCRSELSSSQVAARSLGQNGPVCIWLTS